MLANILGTRFDACRAVPSKALLALLIGCAVNVASAQSISFLPPVNIPVGNNPEAVVVGFLKGDLFLDLAVANAGDNTISILLGNWDGTFQDPMIYSVGSYPWFIATGDFNADSIPDLVVSNHDSGDLTVLLGVGGGAFQPAGTVAIGGNPFSTVVKDLDGDGFEDLAVTDTGNLYFVKGKGDGSFWLPVQIPEAGPNALFVAVGDFNGDTIPDLAVTNARGTDTVTILAGQGDGTFLRVASYPIG